MDSVDKQTKRNETRKKFRENNRERLRQEGRIYYQKNKDKVRDYQKNYLEQNKSEIYEKRKQIVFCECGSKSTKHNLSQHQKSKKHINFIENINC